MNLGRNYAAQRRGKKETAQAPPLKIVRNVRTLPKHLQGRAAHKDPEKKAGTYTVKTCANITLLVTKNTILFNYRNEIMVVN
jgi:hypothetical protein